MKKRGKIKETTAAKKIKIKIKNKTIKKINGRILMIIKFAFHIFN